MKTPAFASALLAVLLAGCSRETVPQVAAAASEAPGTPPAAESNVVTVPADVQKENGIVTAAVHRKPVAESARATARITNDENSTWRVGSIIEGRVVQVLANQGDVVQKDQILAKMHCHDIHEARALYMKAKAEVDRSKGAVDLSTRQRDRLKRLYDLKAGALARVEQKDAELRNAQTEARNAAVEMERARTHLEEVLGIPAEPVPGDEDSDLVPIRAPAAGVILTRNVTPGTVVTPATDLYLISNLESLWAMTELPEKYLGKLRPGMQARVTVEAYPGEVFMGRIGRLGETLNPDTRTARVRVELPNARRRLKPEMYATVEIELGAGEPVLTVPAEAVQDVRGQQSVFVQTAPDKFEIRPVEVGRTLDGAFEITSGLKGEEVICVKAAFLLKSQFLKSTLADE